MKEQDFETYWRKNRQTLLQADKGYQQAAKQFKTTSGADMLLYAIPRRCRTDEFRLHTIGKRNSEMDSMCWHRHSVVRYMRMDKIGYDLI